MNSRQVEIDKYKIAYQSDRYHMGPTRRDEAVTDLAAFPFRGSYLDVACGRGELLGAAIGLGFDPVHGTEVIPELIDNTEVVWAEAWSLPFPPASFDVVSMMDVIEHLLPGDDELACRELARVARKGILLTASNLPSVLNGVELHVNKRPYEEWDRLFRLWFPGRVKRLAGRKSETWRVFVGEGQ